MDPAERARIGRSEVEVTRLGIGLGPLVGRDGPIEDDVVDAIVRCAYRHGIRYFDVAPLYGLGRGEAALQRAPVPDGDPITISTKAGRLLRPRTLRNRVRVRWNEVRYAPDRRRLIADHGTSLLARWAAAPGRTSSGNVAGAEVPVALPHRIVAIHDYRPTSIWRSTVESMARLGRDRVDMLFLHDPDGLDARALRAAWGSLVSLRDSGKAGAIGISSNDGVSLARMIELVDVDVVLLAGRYTLLDQSAVDHVLPAALAAGVSVILGGVFNGGLLADPLSHPDFDYRPAPSIQRRRAERIARIGVRFGVPAVAAALQFPAAHPAVTSVLVGVRSVRELEDDLAHAALEIPAPFWEELVADGIIRDDAPTPLAPDARPLAAG